MAIAAPIVRRAQDENTCTEAHQIPKMELTGSKEPKRPESKVRRYDSLASLIKAFGEFSFITDPNDAIVGFWASRRAPWRRFCKTMLGRPLSDFVGPALAAEIRTLVDQTAARRSRAELECPVVFGNARRWFSVSAIPLEMPDCDGSAVCVAARDVTHRVEAMQTLTEREALLAKAEEIANFGSWEIELKTGDVDLSAHLANIYELTPEQKWSRQMYWERIHPNDRLRVRPLADRAFADGQPVQYMARYRAPSGDVRVHLTHILPILDEGGKVVRALGVVHDITEHAKAHQELQRLSQQLLSEQDTQRRHLARELHESAGQSLAALKMTLGRLGETLAENQRLAASLLESAAGLADNASREVRTVSYLLHPPMLDDAGLGPALRWYVKGFAERSGISAKLEICAPFPRLCQDIETTVFRVVQEALTNVHRYSGSNSAEVRMWHEHSKLHIEVRDRGCGFPPAADPSQRRTELGVGISGMRERVKQLNGNFEISGIPGQGTTVRAVLPAIAVKPLRRSFRVAPGPVNEETEENDAPQAINRS